MEYLHEVAQQQCFRECVLLPLDPPDGWPTAVSPWRLPGTTGRAHPEERLPGPGCTTLIFLSVQGESGHGKGPVHPPAEAVLGRGQAFPTDALLSPPQAHKQTGGSALPRPGAAVPGLFLARSSEKWVRVVRGSYLSASTTVMSGPEGHAGAGRGAAQEGGLAADLCAHAWSLWVEALDRGLLWMEAPLG